MTLGDLTNAVFTEYKTPVAGTSALSIDYVEDIINAVYFGVFNSPELRSYSKKAEKTFQTKANQKLGADLLASAVTVVLDDSSDWPATGTVCIDKKDFFAYTANDLVLTLSGVTGVDVDHDEGDAVELSYAAPSDIDEQQNIELHSGANVYTYTDPEKYFTPSSYDYRSFTIYKTRLYAPIADSQIATLFYNTKLTALATPATDKPTLIPGRHRYDLLVSGAVERIGVRDDMRTGWDWHAENFKKAKKLFIAEMNNPARSLNSNRPSKYD